MSDPPPLSATARRLPAWLDRLRPRTASGQIVLIVVAAIIAGHLAATLALFLLREPWRSDNRPGVAAIRLATIARLVDSAPPVRRHDVLKSAAETLPSLELAEWDGQALAGSASQAAESRIDGHIMIERVKEGFGREIAITDLTPPSAGDEGPDRLRFGLLTPSGARFQASLPDDPLLPRTRGIVMSSLAFLALSLTLLSIWVSRAVSAPLAKLADAAEAYGTRREPPPLPSRGPEEVLAVAGALDRMRARVDRLLDDRTQMLASISHDLRTPITRLRLRAEFIEDPQMRERTLRDLEQMHAMLESTLSYVRAERGEEPSGQPMPLIDLSSLLQTVADSFVDTGGDVRFAGAPHMSIRARPEALERAVGNLVDNALKYAGNARLGLERGAGSIAIVVADDGPGIPEADRQAMLEPFVRGDPARNRNDAGGFGLGLSIVRSIVRAHGGSLVLANRCGGGLDARIVLPDASEAPPAPDRIAAE